MAIDRTRRVVGLVPTLSELLDAESRNRSEQLLSANPWFEDVFAVRKTEIRILIVADGFITFVESEFGLSELINKALLPSATPWEQLEIVKAHRSEIAQGADICSFKFDQTPDPPHNRPLNSYDQIWLFGSEAEKGTDGKPNQFNLRDSELRELAKFMNRGGGLFATGDHEDLGAALCGRVPRVRNMRKWFLADSPPSRDTETRLDTLREGIDQGFASSDQSDSIPQEIRPVFKLNGARNGALPHPLLRKDGFAITVLPDHMHEGECLVPHDLRAEITLDDGTKFQEYPAAHHTTGRTSPEVVAISTSAGGFVNQLHPAPPVVPRCFNIITAYDGHQAVKADDASERDGVGRVVVDASFHHFVDTNLRGTASGHPKKLGLYDESNNPTKDYLAIKQYYRNLVLWLCPPEKQSAYYLSMLLAVRYLSPLIEEIRVVEEPTLQDLLFAGGVTHQAITERFSSADAIQCAIYAAAALSHDLKAVMVNVFEPWEAVAPLHSAAMLLNLDLLLKAVLGGSMLGVAAKLPQSLSDVQNILDDGDALHGQFRSIVSAGLTQAGQVVSQVIPTSHEMLTAFLTTLKASI